MQVCRARQARLLDEDREAKRKAELQARLQASLHREADERAALRALHELVNEHNARIDANQPGIMKGSDGKVIEHRVWLANNKKERQAYVDRVLMLASWKPEWAARLERAKLALQGSAAHLERAIAEENGT